MWCSCFVRTLCAMSSTVLVAMRGRRLLRGRHLSDGGDEYGLRDPGEQNAECSSSALSTRSQRLEFRAEIGPTKPFAIATSDRVGSVVIRSKSGR